MVCPRCGEVPELTVTIGRHVFCAACFEGWCALHEDRIVAEVPPCGVRPVPEPARSDVSEGAPE